MCACVSQVGAVFLPSMETARHMIPGQTAGTWWRPCPLGGHGWAWQPLGTDSMLSAGEWRATQRWPLIQNKTFNHQKRHLWVICRNLLVSRYDGTSDLATVESYDPITNSWQPEVSMGTRRSCLGVAVLHGLLYAAGGYDGASCLNRYIWYVVISLVILMLLWTSSHRFI